MQLAPCPQCRRHVATDSTMCPFCGAAAPRPHPTPTLVGRVSRAAVFSALASCHPTPSVQPPPPPPPPVVATDAGVAVVVPAGTAELRVVVTIAGSAQRFYTRVVVTSLATDGEPLRRDEYTDGHGELLLRGLPPGEYRIEVEQPRPDSVHGARLEPVVRDVRITDGTRQQVDIAVQRYPSDRPHEAMPYGAPPARRRVV